MIEGVVGFVYLERENYMSIQVNVVFLELEDHDRLDLDAKSGSEEVEGHVVAVE